MMSQKKAFKFFYGGKMRKGQIVSIVVAMFAMFSSTSAIVGFGGYGGINIGTSTNDSTSVVINELVVDGSTETASVNLVAGPIENPICFGGHVYVEIPVIPLTVDVSGGAAISTYTGYFNIAIAGNATEAIEIPDIAYASYNFMGTLKYRFIDPPIVKPYIAVGVGSEFSLPVISDTSLYSGATGEALMSSVYDLSSSTDPDYVAVAENLADAISEMDIESRIIINFGAGTKIKLPMIPLAFHVDYRFNIATENDKLPYLPENFQTITAGIGLNF